MRSQAAPAAPIETNTPILPGHRLVIDGRQLQGTFTRVQVGDAPVLVTPAPRDITDSQVIVTLPAGLRAGVQGLQVVHLVEIGERHELRRGFESNVAAFVLRPRILRRPNGSDDINLTSVEAEPDGTRSARVAIRLEPTIAREQRPALLLNQVGAAAGTTPRAYTFREADWTGLQRHQRRRRLPIEGVEPAAQLLGGSQASGAESPLLASAPDQPFSRPTVTI